MACFFSPFLVIYVITGAAYLFGYEGSVRQELEYKIKLDNGWPKSEADARLLISDSLKNNGHPQPTHGYYTDEEGCGWYGYKQQLILKFAADSEHARLIVKSHDLWRRLLLVHKGQAGSAFTVLGVLLAASVTVSVISGLVLALNMPAFRNNAVFFIVGGVVAFFSAFLLG